MLYQAIQSHGHQEAEDLTEFVLLFLLVPLSQL